MIHNTVGVMWMDDDTKAKPKPGVDMAAIRIRAACERYQAKHGQAPNVVYVHPGERPKESIPGIEIHEARCILPACCWAGRQEGAK